MQISKHCINRHVQIIKSELTNFKDFISHISSLPPCTCSREERCDVHPGQYCCARPGLSYWPWNWSLSAKPTIEKQWTGFIRYVSLLWYNVCCFYTLLSPSFHHFVCSSVHLPIRLISVGKKKYLHDEKIVLTILKIHVHVSKKK